MGVLAKRKSQVIIIIVCHRYENNMRDHQTPGLRLALVLARETGHRLGAVISLRWSDIDVERRVVHWRDQIDKIGFDHETPLTSTAIAVLQRARPSDRQSETRGSSLQ
jgi:integrase